MLLWSHVTSLRCVVALLQDVAKKVTEEVRQEGKCMNTPSATVEPRARTRKRIEEGVARITETTSRIEAEEGTVEELETQIKVSQESRAEAKAALASAETLGAKAVRAFEVRISLPTLVPSTGRGLRSRRGAASSSFLQSGIGSAIRKLARSSN